MPISGIVQFTKLFNNPYSTYRRNWAHCPQDRPPCPPTGGRGGRGGRRLGPPAPITPGQNPAVTRVKSQLFWAIPLQSETTPPPGQGRSRLTDQNASRLSPCDLAQSRIWVQVATLVCSCWSERPFMPDMPICA